MDDGAGDGHAVGIGTKKHSVEHLLSNTDPIEQTQLLAICRVMPKGAHLHLHFNAESSVSVWQKFNARTQMMNRLFYYETAYKEYIETLLRDVGTCAERYPVVDYKEVGGAPRIPSHTSESPAKKPNKWSPEEDALVVELRSEGMKWEDVSKRFTNRSPISCRLRYQNYLAARSEWDQERKNKLARLYKRFKPGLWAKVAEETQVPWRDAEAMHWQLGESDMTRRAGVVPFSLNNITLPFEGVALKAPRGHGLLRLESLAGPDNAATDILNRYDAIFSRPNLTEQPAGEPFTKLLEEMGFDPAEMWSGYVPTEDSLNGSGICWDPDETRSKAMPTTTWDVGRAIPTWQPPHGQPNPSNSSLNLPRRLGPLLRLLLPPTLLSLLPLVTSAPVLIPYRTPKIIFLSFSAISSLSTGMTSLQLPPDLDRGIQLAKMWLRILCSVALGVLTVCYTLWFLNGWYARKKRAFLAGFLGCTVFCWVFVNPGLQQGGSSSGEGGKKGGEGDGFVWLDELNLFGLIAVVVGILNAESSLIGAIFSGGGGVGEGVEGGTRAVEDEESQGGTRRGRGSDAARDQAGEAEESSSVRVAGILSLVNNVVGS